MLYTIYFGQDNKICEEPISIRRFEGNWWHKKRNYSDANAFVIDQKFNVDSFL